MSAEDAHSQYARTYAGTAAEAYTASADLFRGLPGDAWSDPTGCEQWTMRDLAGHIAGEAVWYPNLVRGVTANEAPLPEETYHELTLLAPAAQADQIAESADAILAAVDGAMDAQLEQPVNMGWASMPLWRSTGIVAMEAVLHNWDARARREERATIPTMWSQALAAIMPELAPGFAHRHGVKSHPGVYYLEVAEGVGPITITVRHGHVDIHPGNDGNAEVTLQLTADQFVRLLTGRLPLDSAEGESLPCEGNCERAASLNAIFAGIANG